MCLCECVILSLGIIGKSLCMALCIYALKQPSVLQQFINFNTEIKVNDTYKTEGTNSQS